MTPEYETLAVFGGSFDPPHLSHTLAAAYVLGAFAIDRVLIVPAARHPFDKQLSDFTHRCRMLELAMRDLRRVEICTIERELPSPSLTVRTLEALSQRFPGARLRLVIGSDLMAETWAWHDFARIEQLAPPLIVPRAGHTGSSAELPSLPAISSTEARRRLRAGLSTEGYLAPAVAAYAQQHQLYAGQGA
jgi:nicotinate-nucleotide adenylyltransferase